MVQRLESVCVAGEVWRPVPHMPHIEASNVGNLRRARDHRLYNRFVDDSGYIKSNVTRSDGSRTQVAVHRLVAAAFLGPRPDGMQVNHINGVKTDSRIENLEYVTPQENVRHSVRMGLHLRGERQPQAKLTTAAVLLIRSQVASGRRQSAVAADFGISQPQVNRIARRVRWKHVP